MRSTVASVESSVCNVFTFYLIIFFPGSRGVLTAASRVEWITRLYMGEEKGRYNFGDPLVVQTTSDLLPLGSVWESEHHQVASS
ncbi:hypothetical protein FKM82_000159 [Ascaphus truei]